MDTKKADELKALIRQQGHNHYMRGVVSVYNALVQKGQLPLLKKISIIQTRKRLEEATEEYDKIFRETDREIARILEGIDSDE